VNIADITVILCKAYLQCLSCICKQILHRANFSSLCKTYLQCR